MAIGKVNAYATVDTPKADFGAVAQMNIDNLVKSVKEDKQAKAAKAAAEDKLAEEKISKLALFPDQIKSGTQSLDFEQANNVRDLYDKSLEYKRTYEKSGGKDMEAKIGHERTIAAMKNSNAEMKVYGDDLVAVNARIGREEVYPKFAGKISETSTAAADGRVLVKTDPETQVKYIAEYVEDPDNPGKMKLGEYRPASEHLKMYRNAPANIKYQDIIKSAKDTFDVSLREEASSYLRKTGEEKLGALQKTGLYDYYLKMVENDSVAAAIGDMTGVIKKNDYRIDGFKKGEREDMARVMADRTISSYGTKSTVDTAAPQQPREGSGGGDEDTFKPSFVSLTNADFFGNKDKEGQPIDNYARDAKSDVLTGISGTSPKSRKFIIPSLQKWSKGKPTNEKITDFRVNRLIYDRAGRPTVEGDYVDTKSSVYKEAKNTALKAFMEENRANGVVETEKELNERADKELALNAETYGIERTNYVQQIGKVTEKDLATYMSGKKNRGVIIRDVPSMRRAMGYEPKRENKAKKYGI